ncbi:CDP-glucose 4,6-dehydratase [Methylomagnum ishizawai]|uniref:CDP-glucose 4,6-dehydratase n=1 Tax=Methylomagnum ishizawai TaxID=1760988 RepID=A0A1Y6D1X5_9GAMM|nr:CDP-glucose 4,6-dehydratase [Methylomagnum ishizawai]SMF96410.1 CDP-glucose 4,6-dehydratase [Methylomagnum ishizawai]
MTPDFWRGKTVFVTGHTGFKGAWLCLWLQRMGAEVVGYALSPPTEPSLFELANVARDMHSIEGDIRDDDALERALRLARPEIVIHMAAQPLVRHAYAHPVETYSTNIMGTVHLLQAVRGVASVRALVNVTSDKCYENREWSWGYRENEAMGGRDPYSSSKGCAELVTAAFRQSYFGPGGHPAALATARAGNVIGGGDWAEDRLIPDILRHIEAGKILKIRNPAAIRPWQHVLEPLGGYLTLAERLYQDGAAFAEAWNFGPAKSDAKPVRWIVERLRTVWPDRLRWEFDAHPQPHEATHLRLDCEKAADRLGWQPRWHLARALDAVTEWHTGHWSGADPRSLSLRQIDTYMQEDDDREQSWDQAANS